MAEDLNPILIQLLTRLKQSKEVEWWLTNQKSLFTVSLSALPGTLGAKAMLSSFLLQNSLALE